MKDILKMALTLMLITAVSAASLSYVHSVTSVIIEEREAERTREAIKAFFPDAVTVEEVKAAGVVFQAVYGAGNQFQGVLAEARAKGYAGPIPYQLIIDSQGKIINIIYGSNEETVGIGKKIEDEAFKSKIIGLTPADPIQAGKDIDIISGATVSSTGMAQSLRDTMDKFAAAFPGR
jgi:Na+-translocating ferredoxin:NAD+ oxidoreductase subunit G